MNPKKGLLRSLLSIFVAGIFVLLAVGSFDTFLTDALGFKYETNLHRLDNMVTHRYWFGHENFHEAPLVITGQRDLQGRFHGAYIIQLRESLSENPITIGLKYEHGKMHGSYVLFDQTGLEVVGHRYFMGHRDDEDPENKKSAAETSGFDRLESRYTWLLHYLAAYGFNEEYVQHYMDTLEVVLSDFSFESEDFNEYYDEALDILKETPLDSIIELNDVLSGIRGMELVKDIELRLAVIEHFREGENSTNDIVSDTYPEILNLLEEEGISPGDFEQFCNDLDDSIAMYGPLDPEDDYFIDSVDTRLYRAIMAIYFSGEEDAKKAYSLASLPSIERRKSYSISADSPEFAEMMLYLIVMEFFEGDMIRRAVREAWMSREGIVTTPIVATQVKALPDESSADIEGYVMEDGGAEVSDRGITWGLHHNPDMEDHVESAGNGTGKYTAHLNGLDKGVTYYARAFATNTAGTKYGNCVSFIPSAGSATGKENHVKEAASIFPNPATTDATCIFVLEEPATVVITLTDMAGRCVYRKEHGNLTQGDQKIKMDLGNITGGTYLCEIRAGAKRISQQKLLVQK